MTGLGEHELLLRDNRKRSGRRRPRPSGPDDKPGHTMNIGYVVSRFPKTTETFIAREALGVSGLGHQVVMVDAINRESDEIVQAEAAGFVNDLTALAGRTRR